MANSLFRKNLKNQFVRDIVSLLLIRNIVLPLYNTKYCFENSLWQTDLDNIGVLMEIIDNIGMHCNMGQIVENSVPHQILIFLYLLFKVCLLIKDGIF